MVMCIHAGEQSFSPSDDTVPVHAELQEDLKRLWEVRSAIVRESFLGQ